MILLTLSNLYKQKKKKKVEVARGRQQEKLGGSTGIKMNKF